MEKRKQRSRQTDLFARDPDRMQWLNLPARERRQAQTLFAQLALDIFSQIVKGQKHKEDHHAREDYA